MSTKRTAALAVGVAILIGGGATALAATSDDPARPTFEAVAPTSEARSTDTAAAERAVAVDEPGTGTTSSDLSADGSAPAADNTTESAPSTSSPSVNEERSGGDAAGMSDRLAGPDAAFATMPTVPWDWNGFDDSEVDNPDYPYDGPGLPFDINNINLDSLISLARSVGIEVGDPVVAEDGSITVTVTLPDDSEHTVWVAIDSDHHITDATVDGTPVMEFVRQFLSGEIGRPAPPVEPHPEWNLPD